MRKILLSVLGVFGLVVFLAGGAHAEDSKFHKVPGTVGKALQMRTVTYNGGTNGRMVIEVRNRSKKSKKFEAAGLYFVPGGDPEKAPQRLGAAGPFEIVSADGKTGDPIQSTVIKPGESIKIELHVFCIDSHRSSPNSETPFAVANKLMPKKLRGEIQAESKKVLKRHKNKLEADAVSEIQSNVWKSRNKKWIKLEGERANEKNEDVRPQREQRRHRRPRQK